MSNRKYFALAGSIIMLFLAACGTAAEQAISTTAVAESAPAMVSATGIVVPEREALLSVTSGGVVEEILVEKGEQVNIGQVLVRLEGSQAQFAAVSNAELQLLNAQLGLESLYENTELAAAEALRAAEAAERALEDLLNPELQEAQSAQAVADAEKAVDDAEQRLSILTKPPTQYVLDQAQGNILLAEKNLDQTLEQIEDLEWQYKKYSANKKLPDSIKKKILINLRQALKGLEVKRSQEQLSLEDSRMKFDDLLAPPDPSDVQVAEAELATTQARLGTAERDLQRVLDGPQAGELALLEAQIKNGYRDYDLFSNGPDPDDVAIAEAQIRNAEAQLAAAQAAIADQELKAPFEGVISRLRVNRGEWVAPGSPVVQIGDLSQLQIETTDLGEIDVAQIKVGDQAVVTFDSLPDMVLSGTVSRIAPKADEGSGVNYPVIIKLDQVPEALRWGMTAFVDIALD